MTHHLIPHRIHPPPGRAAAAFAALALAATAASASTAPVRAAASFATTLVVGANHPFRI